MSLKIALEGIDGSGKTTIARYLSARKQRICPVMGFVGFTNSDISTSLLARWLGKKTTRLLQSGSRKSNKFIEGLGYLFNWITYRLAQHRVKPYDVVLSDRDVWVTHLVYAGVVSNRLGRLIDPYLNRYAGYPRVLFYLKTDVKNSLRRTESRGYFQNHENKACLEKLNERYDAVINRIIKQGLSTVIKIDTNEKSLDAVCKRVESDIRVILKNSTISE